MPDKFKKIDKDFVLSDSSVNVYRFRMLTDGYRVNEFLKNPIGFYMHGEAPEHPRSQGVLVRWEDVRLDGDKVMGRPVINLSHPRGQQTVDEVESGFLNGASFGDMVVLASRNDDDPDNPGETIPTLTDWYNKECSLVTMPGNRGAFACPKLYDINDVEIKNLADFPNSKQPIITNNMAKIMLELTPALLALVNLSDKAEEKDFTAAIQNLADRAAKSDQYKTDKEKAESALESFQESTVKAQVKNLLDDGLSKNKLTKKLADTLAADYAKNPVGLKTVLDSMPVYNSIVDNLADADDKKASKIKNLTDKTWEQLDKSNGLAELKALSPEAYAAKHEEQFGKKPTA